MSFIDVLWINGVASVFAIGVVFIIFIFIDNELLEDIIWYGCRYIIWMGLVSLVADISLIDCAIILLQAFIVAITIPILGVALYSLRFGISEMRAMALRVSEHPTALSAIEKCVELGLISYFMWIQLS